MKTTILKSVFLLALFASLFSSCINDDDYDTPEVRCTETTLVKTKEVSQIPVSSTVTQYTSDDVIEGYVTSSDKGGNFFKSISFQTKPTDGSDPIGFSVPVDVTSTFINLEPGRKVLIKMKNLYTDISNGGKRFGGIFISSSNVPAVGRLTPAEYRTVLNRSCTVVPEAQLLRTLTISQLKNDANINTLVELDGVQFTEQSLGKTYYDPSLNNIGGATNHLLSDAEGNTVIFRVSSFANFASKPIPNGRGKVRGVMTKFGSDYQFFAREESDVQLTGARLVPIFSENFESISNVGNGQNIALPGWSNVSMNNGQEKWEARSFSGNKYAQFSPFGITPVENNVDTRLITPAINLTNTSGAFLRFGSKTGFANGVAVTLWVSTDYDGSGTVAAVNAATWTQLPAIFAPQSTSFPANFTSSGNIDLSAYTGNVYFSFRYVGGTNNITTTYQIDNVEVYAQ